MTGGRVNRFNLVKQSKDYDADGAYVRHWLPELANVPTEKVHEPWKMSKDEMERSMPRGAYGDASCDYLTPPKSHLCTAKRAAVAAAARRRPARRRAQRGGDAGAGGDHEPRQGRRREVGRPRRRPQARADGLHDGLSRSRVHAGTNL